MKRLEVCLLCWALSCSSAACQERDVNPTTLAQELKAGTVDPDIARALGLTCTDWELQTDTSRVQLKKNETYSVVQAYQLMCNQRAVVVFRAVGGRWKHVQTVLLSTLLGVQPKVTFPDLLGSGDHEIVVSGQLVDHGTGVDQNNMTIFKLIGDRLQVVFDAPESVHFEQGSSHGLYSVEQRSVFRFVADSESHNNELMILEKQKLTHAGKTIVRYRGWTWSPELQRFRCYETAP